MIMQWLLNHGLLMILLFILYFAPYFTARARKKKNAESIGIINFFLGWTVIGWIVSLAWAVAKD